MNNREAERVAIVLEKSGKHKSRSSSRRDRCIPRPAHNLHHYEALIVSFLVV